MGNSSGLSLSAVLLFSGSPDSKPTAAFGTPLSLQLCHSCCPQGSHIHLLWVFLPHLSLGLSATGRNCRPSYSPRSFYSSLYASSPMYSAAKSMHLKKLFSRCNPWNSSFHSTYPQALIQFLLVQKWSGWGPATVWGDSDISESYVWKNHWPKHSTKQVAPPLKNLSILFS